MDRIRIDRILIPFYDTDNLEVQWNPGNTDGK